MSSNLRSYFSKIKLDLSLLRKRTKDPRPGGLGHGLVLDDGARLDGGAGISPSPRSRRSERWESQRQQWWGIPPLLIEPGNK